MIEAGVVIGTTAEELLTPIFWHLPQGRTGGSLPDSRTLWEVLWDSHQKRTLIGFAHSHPGGGVPGPSHTDLTTFSAVERGLGCRLLWWITSDDALVVLRWSDEHEKYRINQIDHPLPCKTQGCWVEELRRLSK